ncbi:hypothetical protein OS493_038454 [Desmophyllum pertusum]|uniref:Uncharacterized protein n=1 Tax=Desmophyllum pertusum TaxID=174260 RepID=A0A9X0CPJ8_9CNID|nr:hypothetical protein OS493_038454 [Desmophyllum pertusum]
MLRHSVGTGVVGDETVACCSLEEDGVKIDVGEEAAANAWYELNVAEGVFVWEADLLVGTGVVGDGTVACCSVEEDGAKIDVGEEAAANVWYELDVAEGIFVWEADLLVGTGVVGDGTVACCSVEEDGAKIDVGEEAAANVWYELDVAEGVFVWEADLLVGTGVVGDETVACCSVEEDGVKIDVGDEAAANVWYELNVAEGVFVWEADLLGALIGVDEEGNITTETKIR